MSIKYAILFSFGHPKVLHEFDLPEVSDPQYAVDLASLEETRSLEEARRAEYLKAGSVSTHQRLSLEFIEPEDYRDRMKTIHSIVGPEGIVVMQHESIRDLYRAVGYDHERKCFEQMKWASAGRGIKNPNPEYVAIHHRDGNPVALYRIELISDGSLSSQAASMDSFLRCEDQRASEAIKKGVTNPITRKPSIEYTEVSLAINFELNERFQQKYRNFSVIRPATVANFFKAIGYDPVRQSYTKPALDSEAEGLSL